MIKVHNLEFFDKLGNNLNLEKDTKGILTGNITIGNGKVSSGLIENEQITILEKVWNEEKSDFDYLKVTDTDENSDFKLYTRIKPEDESEFFVFGITFDNLQTPFINKSNEKTFSGTYNSILEDINIGGIEYTNIKDNATKSILSSNFDIINIGFSSNEGGSYRGTLEIYIEVGGQSTLLANINYFVDVEEEDERLTLLLENLGSKFYNKDFLIFDTSDIKESEIDFTLMNQKRKELLLEFNNIFPHLGSYKALINIIKFFGYESLVIKEYWKNVKVDSENFGKYKPVDIAYKLDNNKKWVELEETLGQKVWKKTDKFGMYYQINQDSGRFDEDGTPLTTNVFNFTLDEVLIKLYALRQKLKDYFLPLNSKIVDIVGEALYYNSYDFINWNVLNKIDAIDVNITPSFKSGVGNYGFIKDLRPLEWIGAKIGNDLTLDGIAVKRVFELEITSVNFGNFVILKDHLEIEQTRVFVGYHEGVNEVAFNLFNEIKKVKSITDDFYITVNGNKILFVERFTNDKDYNLFGEVGKFSNTLPTFNREDINNGDGETTVEEFGNTYLSYFFDNNFDINNLGNNEDIPVGFPVLLRNTSFDITWDSLNLTWNSLDENKTYKGFNFSSDSGFPSSIYNSGSDSISGKSWDNIGDREFFEVSWRVWKDADETPSFEYTFSDIPRIAKEIFLILPYVGKYNVELILYDHFGSFSKKIEKDFIEVEQKNPDFTSWKIKDLTDLKWNDFKDLTWDQISSSWELPFLPNPITDYNYINWMSIDRIEFYQNLVNQDALFQSLYDVNGQTWRNMGDEVQWGDLDHLYWDMLSPSFTKFIISDLENGEVTITVKNEFGKELDSLTLQLDDTKYGSNYDVYTDFIDKIYDNLDEDINPILSSFIYDIRYQNQSTTSNIISKTIVAVSKKFEKPNRYYFDIDGGTATISERNTNINGFGVLGDSPTSFDIYTTSTISGDPEVGIINVEGIEVEIPLHIDTLQKLVDFLRDSDLGPIWDFNIVKNANFVQSGNDYLPTIEKYIICSKKEQRSNEEISVYLENVYGTKIARSITTNASWSSLDVIYYQRDVKPYTQVYFNYDISKLPGFKNPTWKIINSKTGDVIFTWNNKYLVYLFVNPGEYDISLELEDTNGNKKVMRKNGLIRVQK